MPLSFRVDNHGVHQEFKQKKIGENNLNIPSIEILEAFRRREARGVDNGDRLVVEPVDDVGASTDEETRFEDCRAPIANSIEKNEFKWNDIKTKEQCRGCSMLPLEMEFWR